jgi:hypothetical protein
MNKQQLSQQQKPQPQSQKTTQSSNSTKMIYEQSKTAADNTTILIGMLTEPQEKSADPIQNLLDKIDQMAQKIEGLETSHKLLTRMLNNQEAANKELIIKVNKILNRG